jgi:putative ABC transport system permease protein
MIRLVLSNTLHRKTRSAVTVLGVAVGVVLVVLVTGLARGQLDGRAKREARTGADVLVRPGGAGTSPVSTSLTFDLSVVPEIEAIDGVAAVVPLAQCVERNEASAFGFRSFDGVDPNAYASLSGLEIVDGRMFAGDGEAIVDEYFARTGQGRVGGTVRFGDAELRIVGVYAPESMSRIKVPISLVQERFDAYGAASMLLVKTREGTDVEEVGRAIRDLLPDNQVVLARDIPSLVTRGVPALDTFLNVVVGLALVVSTLVIMLTMHTTVIERTRQIGVLRSLGASRAAVVWAIEAEAAVLGLAGVVVGNAVAAVAAPAIVATTTLVVEVSPAAMLTTFAVGVSAAALGALYPAIRAAQLDPVTALSRD